MQKDIENLFVKFHDNNKSISNKQIIYLKTLFNQNEINILLKKYNCASINNLKYYQVYQIFKSEIFINNNEIYLLINFFTKNIINEIYNIFKENNIIEYDLYYEKYINSNDKNIFDFLSKIKKKTFEIYIFKISKTNYNK